MSISTSHQQPTQIADPQRVTSNIDEQNSKPEVDDNEHRSPAEADASLNTDPAHIAFLTRTDRWFITIIVVIGACLGILNWVWHSSLGLQPVEIRQLDQQPYHYYVDINRANWLELMLLDGIGETLAKRIVSYREAHGPYEQIDDLLQVKGIGPKRLEKLRHQVTCRSKSTSD